MKRLWRAAGLLLSAVMAMGMAGCGDQTTGGEGQVQTPEEKIEANLQIDESKINLVQFGEVKADAQKVKIETTLGDIELVLYPEEAPENVANFLALAKQGYYNGLKFHRVLANYLIQAGDPSGTGTGGESSVKDADGNKVGVAQEYSLNLWNFRGAVGMVPGSDGNNASQFYVIQNAAVDEDTLAKMKEGGFPQKVIDQYKTAGGAPWMDSKYTVIGQVVSGMDVVDEIAAQEVGEDNVPTTDVVITKITVE